MRQRQVSLFEGARLDLEGAVELSLASLREYGQRYRHWAVAYSGGKDSSATVTFTAWAIRAGLIPAPDSLTVLYSDTRQELPPLQQAAVKLLGDLSANGINTRIVLPAMDKRFYAYILGRGVPPPKNRFRWCTNNLKIVPMLTALQEIGDRVGEKFLMLTGMRLGESAARDQRIALSCSKNGECGQGMLHDPDNEGEKHAGWFQPSPPDAITDTLAPLIHWRLCHIYDWLYFEQDRHGYNVDSIAVVYGEDDVRTGCAGCNLTSKDVALLRLVKNPDWSHLRPLLELKQLFKELTKAKSRLRKSAPEIRKDGKPAKNVQRLGPLTMAAREYGLEKVLDIQRRARVDLINPEEEARIRELWALGVWPDGWTGSEITGDVPIDAMRSSKAGDLITIQSLLVR